jgi:hypothetical protein
MVKKIGRKGDDELCQEDVLLCRQSETKTAEEISVATSVN